MAEQEYRVRLTADTKQASDKLDAVQDSLSRLTSKSHDIKVSVDANAIGRASRDTQEIANSIRSTRANITAASATPIVSADSLSAAAALATQFYSIRKDVRGIEGDLGKALGQTNVSEFMRTEQFLDRVLDNSRTRTKEIVETYKNVRELPGVAGVVGPVENFARAKAWETYGDRIAEQTVRGAKEGLARSVEATKGFLYGDLFSEISVGANQTIDLLARLGLAIQGVQLLVGPLAAAWSAAFDLIIGQNIRLEQTMLSTQTTLASTGRIFNQSTGQEVKDPFQKIQALEGGVKRAIDNIRIRSLDLAGVTSQQIIDIFGVVATSISQVNGNLKDAEDLAISFTAALGTLGIPFYQARQEIGSILGGYITEDSLLAKRLQISNKDIEKAKNSVDGVVGYLKKKLETAVAGQAIQAKGFSGVLSNIKEVFEVIGQKVGQPWLRPLVGGLTVVYNFLKQIQGVVTEVGEYLSRVFANTVTSIVEIFTKSKLSQSIGSFVQQLAQPYKDLAHNIELGLQTANTNLLEKWLNGTEKIPRVIQGVVSSLQSFSNFLRLQLSLIAEPITQLLDQSRAMAEGGTGIAQRAARILSIPFGNFIELNQTFTMGWDTLSSTIQAASAAIAKFGAALIKLKITEITAQIRAAAKVFEVFGSVILGRLNLAISFFDFLGSALNNDVVKYVMSVSAISRLIESTDFFGIKGIIVWATQTRVILKQLIGDAGLFVKGFRDAGNIENILSSVRTAYAKVFSIEGKSENPVLRNAAQIEQVTQKIASLNAVQAQMAANGAGAVAMERYSRSIQKANETLAELQRTQQSFTAAQRASAAVKSVFGGGAELAQAKEAARQAQVMASGAATAQALTAVMEALGQKLGIPIERLKTLGGAAQAAAKSLQTFLTTSALINIGFTAATLAISAGIAAWQRYEEAQKKAANTARNMAEIQKILASGYASVFAAAESGDIASQKLLNTQRDIAQSQYSISTEDLTEAKAKYKELNDQLFTRKRMIEQLKQLSGPISRAQEYTSTAVAAKLEGEIVQNKKLQIKLEKERSDALRATLKLQQEEKAAQDFKVLGERRLDLEQRIKEAREDYTKEIEDKQFAAAQERISLERQAARERIDQEKAALNQRFQLLSANADDQEDKAIQLLGTYKTGLLDAADAEAQRKTDLEQKQQQLRKAVDDYAFNMARQRIRLEKELGGYQKQMEDYKTRMTDLRIQKELSAERSLGALKGIYYEPYNLESQQAFVNASQRSNYDHREVYAYLQTIPKSDLGITGETAPDVIMDKLKQVLLIYKSRGVDTSLEGIAKYQGLPPSIIPKLIREAEIKFNTSRWARPEQPNNIDTPNLTIDWAGMQASLSAYNEAIIEATRDLQAAQRAGDKQKSALLLSQARDPSLVTGVKADYNTELDRGRTKIITMLQAIGNIGDSSSFITTKIAEAQQAIRARVRGLLRDANTRGVITTKEIEDLATAISKGDAKLLDKSGFYEKAKKLDFSVLQMLNATFNQAIDAINRIRTQGPNAFKASRYEQFTEALNASFKSTDSKDRLQRQLGLANTFISQKFPENENAPLEQRLARIRAEGLLTADVLKKVFPEISASLGVQLQEATERWINDTQQLERDLEPLQAKIRAATDPIAQFIRNLNKELSDTRSMVVSLAQSIQSELGSAMSNAVTGVLEGTSTVQEAFAQMFRNIGKAFLDMAVQMIAKALIMKALGILFPGAGAAAATPTGQALTWDPKTLDFIPKRAAGGPVSAGRPYIVGERGPELFTSDRSGSIIPNHALGGVQVGSVNITVENTGDALSPTAQKQIAGQVKAIVLATLADQKRGGGMLR